MRTIRFESAMLGAAVLLAPVLMNAQMPNATGSTSQAQAASQMASLNPGDTSLNATAGVDTDLMKERIFVRKLTEDGVAEAQFGKLAAQKASGDDVKKLAQTMVDDHPTIDRDIKPVTDELGLRTDERMSKMDQDEFTKLSALAGTDFDKEYLTYMLRCHRRNLHEFRTEASQTTDPLLKDAVGNLEPVILGHLAMVNKLALANGVASARKGPPPVQPQP
jgi:putative membrane protein